MRNIKKDPSHYEKLLVLPLKKLVESFEDFFETQNFTKNL
jgi:hypothetical protein